MGKKETINLIDTFSEFKELKGIDRMTLIAVMEESFRSVISKMFGSDDNFDVIINPDKGDFEIYRNRIVVEDDEFEDENTQIKLSEAQKVDEDFEVGEEVTDALDFMSFGRRAILNLRQTLSSKILELQKENVFAKYSEKVGQIVNAELYQIWKKEMLLLDEEGNELYLPKSEQIPTDFYRKGDTVRAVVAMVENKILYICSGIWYLLWIALPSNPDRIILSELRRKLPNFVFSKSQICIWIGKVATKSELWPISGKCFISIL